VFGKHEITKCENLHRAYIDEDTTTTTSTTTTTTTTTNNNNNNNNDRNEIHAPARIPEVRITE